MVLTELLQGLKGDQVGKRKHRHSGDKAVPLPTPELLLGYPQHTAHVLARELLLRRTIEHAKILACAAEQVNKNRQEKSTGTPHHVNFAEYFSSCIHARFVTIGP
jgi:hypothetical protein